MQCSYRNMCLVQYTNYSIWINSENRINFKLFVMCPALRSITLWYRGLAFRHY